MVSVDQQDPEPQDLAFSSNQIQVCYSGLHFGTIWLRTCLISSGPILQHPPIPRAPVLYHILAISTQLCPESDPVHFLFLASQLSPEFG